MRYYVALSLVFSLFMVPWLAVTFPESADQIALSIRRAGVQLAATIATLHKPRTIAELQNKYASNNTRKASKVKVLIVPGHEPDFGGTESGALKERDINVLLGEQLALFLSSNGKYEVIMSRTKQGWVPVFSEYFDKEWDNIIAWQKAHREESLTQVLSGSDSFVPKVKHNAAPSSVAYRLYGLTKWSNENGVDIIIHVHFNDYPGHPRGVAGKYSGFSIYTPEAQYANGTTTRALSEAVFKRLQRYNPVSDLPGESGGIVEERELIAIGANNTSDAASMLIEYGYIYEPQLVNEMTRDLALKDLAFQTYLGLEDFFNPKGSKELAAIYDTLVLPYTWNRPLPDAGASPRDVYALQTALLYEGVYPPVLKTKNDCPRTGKIGPCTKSAVELFKQKYNIEESGIGEKTLQELNKRYSGVL